MRNIKIILGALALILAAIGAATAHGPSVSSARQGHTAQAAKHDVHRHWDMANRRHAMHHLRKSMRKYRDPAVAVAAGWVATDECVELPDGSGGMGFHYFNPQLASAKPRLRHPAVLVYVPTRDGGRRLGAVEWFSPDADQDLATDSDRPHFGSLPFNGPMEGHEPGMPVHYDLHAWLFKHNPDGRFASFNPRVHC